ncbi:hypothetical protein Agabi119p4_8499 [Agaricus bisporus var. burnettii]|uniref:Uncharacterized protein n=1 Tax=Agaricus bisporus var. burnettii TaxID=192524 RepID=A0A8H7EYF9_AGABI|nr:hypothetical protein Agabi119p4_8499 [Agaricus bisporus var. burnettii]
MIDAPSIVCSVTQLVHYHRRLSSFIAGDHSIIDGSTIATFQLCEWSNHLIMLPWELCQVESGCQYSTFQLHWTIGIVIGAVIFGALLTLGMSCVRLLAPLDGKRLLQLRLLRVYVISLMLINTIYGVENFLWSNFLSIFGDEAHERRFFASIQLACTFTMVLVGVLTDGLLVWRCYMVQRVLMPSICGSIRMFCWVFPACLWMTMIALGITGGVIEHQVTTPGKLANIATSCLTTALAANITLNLFTTVFIISRLILYRRMVKNSFGVRREEHLHHTRVVGMLLESAAINVPITVIALVGIATWSSYGDFMMSVVTPGQSFASVLVMYQVALGKAIGGRPGAVIEKESNKL